ncbi:MAG: alanine racemase [Verrucomicrobiales bacterium]|nr:alanine racemase [Verrucomicrobiales bacterium]
MDPCHFHLANSAGLLGYQDQLAFTNLARSGLALYGISPLEDSDADLRPVMSLKTQVTLIRSLPAGSSISYGRTFVSARPIRAATLAAGYADGIPRHLSGNRMDVLIGGQRCPLLGRVTMDQIVVDVSHVEEVPIGDEAVLIGEQESEEITAVEWAEKAGTIPWEILTGLSNRVERIYLNT